MGTLHYEVLEHSPGLLHHWAVVETDDKQLHGLIELLGVASFVNS